MSTTTSKTQPALIGGLVMGVLSALPLISAVNLCCCLWVIAGGVVAAYLLQQNQTTPITPGDGAVVGLMAGLIGAVICVVVSIPVSLITGPIQRAFVDWARETAGAMPPEAADLFDRLARSGEAGGAAWYVAQLVGSLMVFLVAGAVFSTLGGLIGAAIFRKSTPISGSTIIDVPPSS